jgi:hypothetical protein
MPANITESPCLVLFGASAAPVDIRRQILMPIVAFADENRNLVGVIDFIAEQSRI